MEKLIFLGLTAFALAGCSSNISNSNQLIGNWKCTINYNDFNISTVDNLKFAANGNITNQGTINYPLQKPIFIYAIQQNGRWNLQNNKIVYRVVTQSLQRTHRAEIWAELQGDPALQQFEENLFSSLSDNENNKTIELTVTDFSNQKMEIRQEVKGHRTYKGQCLKKLEE